MDSKSVGEFQNQETEEALLFLLLTNHEKVKIYLPDIHEDYFFHPTYQNIYKTIVEITNDGGSVDIITIKKKLHKIVPALLDIMKSGAIISSIKDYIAILKEHADKRWFVQSCGRSIESKEHPNKSMSALSSKIIDRLRGRDKEQPSIKNIISEFEQYQAENKAHLKSGNKFIGLESGFPYVDEAINGIRKGHYWIVNAYTNTGKSYFLLNIANKLLNEGRRVLYFSLEMSRVQNIARILGLRTRVDPTVIERGDNSGNELEEELNAKAVLYDQDLTLYTQKRTIEDILVTIYAEHSMKPVDCVMIDYIQKIQTNESVSRYERYTNASDMIQKICQELSIPALVASQIDNQTAKSKATDMVSTKGSGDIGGDVDLAIMLQKSENDINCIECFIQKNRYGMKGGCTFKFGDGGNLYQE